MIFYTLANTPYHILQVRHDVAYRFDEVMLKENGTGWKNFPFS